LCFCDIEHRAMSARAQKERLRRETRQRILALERGERRGQEDRLIRDVADLPGFGNAETILLYLNAFPEEIVTRPLAEDVLSTGRRLACPRVDRASGGLTLHRVRDLADLAPGTRGILEPSSSAEELAPEQVDWALIPGLAFDERCFRLGRGAGHYDRLIPTLRASSHKWAIALDVQVVGQLPVEPHDQPVHGLLTPSRCMFIPRDV
jgi:5-formyltetrahydrofolate cyclo-ligase